MNTEWSGHHHDKDQLRAEIWSSLKQNNASISDPFGHIPNFVGAKTAAEMLAESQIWQQAASIKCNPDSPQIPVRLRALQDGKRLYMAVPRLTDDRCFVELTAEDLYKHNIPLAEAAIAKTAVKCGRLVSFAQMQPIDLVIVGCVAVTRHGGRTGKGAGFADLELAMLQEFGLVKTDTPIVTTVHSLQIVADSRLPMQPHDWALDWVVTPDEVIATNTNYPRPTGLNWEELRAEQLANIPILRKLQAQFIALKTNREGAKNAK
ncbi:MULTISPECIES: 5-formyltetrahydrofolate cyclo-ligase [unclassified Microcoleus]|uniref:5-formyltetrahydrofolate cyclo-ligase n=1 Tax=unclassified Microcoleus TaxID=2642155 RepID=UPI002FD33D0F